MENLIKLNNYHLFTFQTTSHSLKAEKILKSVNMEFTTIPTLREISTSCGLSIKVRSSDYLKIKELLNKHKIQVAAIYKVDKIDNKNYLEKLV
ncbi:MAG TPA: DUF3343 domain-containing protein [Syntrophomonadaceae bacterium]|nr:DUF3343 domain-containing protein [Syntrophomonadaceae bacterium]